MHKLESTVYTHLKASKAKSLLVAISGGADSVALLSACAHLAPRLNIRIEAVNCNFHLRGDESNRDSKFTASICHSLGIKLHAIDYDVESYLKDNPGASTEMACRELRYLDFYRLMDEEEFDRIAIAHNSDDDIETMIMNMLRGSGSRGLKGMEIDNGKIIRPLLKTSREEIERYLNKLGIDYIIDSSNLSSEYRRNFIRREVLPMLESRWQGARKSLYKTVSILKEESKIIEDFYRKQLETLCPKKDTLLIYNDGVTVGTVLRFLEPFGGSPEIANEIMGCLHKKFKKREWKLSEKYEAILERDYLKIVDRLKPNADPRFIWTRLGMQPDTMKEVKGNRNHNIAYLPSDAESYTIRRTKTGDRMSPLGMHGTRLVSDIISDAHLDRHQKEGIRVLQRNSDGEIIWVSGLKRSRYDLLSKDGTYCYKLEFFPTEPT